MDNKMAEVGYGQCKQQVCIMVKKLLDENGRDSEISEIWIECELCGQWYHLECTTLQVDNVTEDIDFISKECI